MSTDDIHVDNTLMATEYFNNERNRIKAFFIFLRMLSFLSKKWR